MYGVTGWVRNDSIGTVSMEVQGTVEQIKAVILAIQRGMHNSIVNDINVITKRTNKGKPTYRSA